MEEQSKMAWWKASQEIIKNPPQFIFPSSLIVTEIHLWYKSKVHFVNGGAAGWTVNHSFVCWSNKNWSHLEHTLQDTSSCHAAFQIIDFTAGLVHIKRSDDWKTKKEFTQFHSRKSNAKHNEENKKQTTRLVRVCVFLPMSRGSEVKSLMGTGIFLTMYSQTTSMLYFSCAEIGMMGAPSATVPAGETRHTSGHSNQRFRERVTRFLSDQMSTLRSFDGNFQVDWLLSLFQHQLNLMYNTDRWLTAFYRQCKILLK